MLTIVTPAVSYDLTVIQTVRAELGISNNSEDENLRRWIKQASAVIANYCNRVFAEETVAETFRLTTGQESLLLSRYPVVSIVSVTEYDTVLDPADYEVSAASGVLTRLSNDAPACWSAGKIMVTYVAGYALLTDLPYGIEAAAIALVKQMRFAAQRDPQIRSESGDGLGSSSFFDGLENGGLSPEVRGLLAEYRKPAGA